MSYPVSTPTSYHGVFVTASGLTGLVQSATANVTSNEATAKDEKGNTMYAEWFDFVAEASMELIVKDATGVQCGDTITYSGFKDSGLDGTYVLTNVTETQSNTDFVKYSVTGKRYLVNAIPSAV